MLCNVYNSEDRCRHWSTENPDGFCSSPTCRGLQIKGDIIHILRDCDALSNKRLYMLSYLREQATANPLVSNLIFQYADPHSPDFIQFLLDCSSLPLVIQSCQTNGKIVLDILFKLCRNFCFSMHNERKSVLNQQYISQL